MDLSKNLGRNFLDGSQLLFYSSERVFLLFQRPTSPVGTVYSFENKLPLSFLEFFPNRVLVTEVR
jgi:hypothetical protein